MILLKYVNYYKGSNLIDTKTASQILGITTHRIKQIVDEKGISTYKKPGRNTRIKFPNDSFRKLLKIRGYTYEKSKITIGQEKGGVGKSLLTFNIAVNMAFRGAKVLIMDLDPEACITNLIIQPKNKDKNFFNDF